MYPLTMSTLFYFNTVCFEKINKICLKILHKWLILKKFLFQIPCWTPRWITVSNNILNTLNGYLVIAYWAVQHSLVCHASHHNSFAIQCKLNEGWNCDRYAAIISMYALVISCFILNRLLQLQIAFRQKFKISNVKNEILLKNDSWRTQVLRRKLI